MALIRITRRVAIVLCCGVIVFLAVSLLRSGRSVSDSEAVVSEEDIPEPRVVNVHAPEEIVELRDRTTRIYKVIREVEITDPVTRETRVEQAESRIIEKANNLCYRDEWGSFVPSIAEFEAVPGGFVADRNNFGLGVGETLGQGLTATFEGLPVMMRAAYLVLSDGTRSLTLAEANPNSLGELDVQDPSIVRFPRAFGDLADLEYIVRKGGYHQNVVINKPIALPTGFDPDESQILVYSEFSYDDLVSNRSVKVTDVNGEIDLSALNSFSASSEEEISFQMTSGEGKSLHLFSFGESEVWDSAPDPEEVKRTVAGKQLFRSEDRITYLVERVSHSFLRDARYPVVVDYVVKTGSMTQDETWSPPNTYYITGTLTVSGAKLTIRPGTTVKFENGVNGYLEIRSGACLEAEGAPYNYIVFTSKQDDLCGEDLTDGSTSGTRADYKYAVYLRADASTNSVIKYCKVGYAYYGIRTDKNTSSLPPIENNIISQCRYGIWMYRQTDAKNNLITNCNEAGIYVQHGGSPQYESLISNNTFNACFRALSCYWTNVVVTARYNIFSNCGYGVADLYDYATISLDYNAYYHNTYYDVYNCTKGSHDVTLPHNNYPSDSPFDSSPLGDFYLKDSFTQLKNKPCVDPEMGFQPDSFTTHKPEVAPPSITGNVVWDKVEHETTPDEVDIGYHHNRVDYHVESDCVVSGSSASLTINPGVAVAIGGFHFLYPTSGARLTSVGEPLGAGYNVITNSKSASMLMESPVISSSNPGVIIFSDASAQSAVEYTRFTWLTFGVGMAGNVSSVVKNNIFAMNHYGVYKSGGALTCFNNLFHHNNMGARLLSGDAILYNNTFDSNTTGIDYERSSGHILFFKDNLFTLNGLSVALRYSGDVCQHNYNVYWGTPPHIYDYLTQSAVDIGPQSRELVSSPYDAEKQGWEGGWYLKQKPDEGEAPEGVLAVDCGSQSAQMAGLDEFTTSVNLKPDTGAVDVASHHPIDLNRDSDSDTMPDWWEDLHGLDPHDPDDAESDTDEDTIYASLEYQAGTDPNDEDSDHDGVSDADDSNPTGRTDRDTDGMTDDWETHHFGDLSHGAGGDYDSDGLSNWEEWNLDTDPTNPDTDSDGIPDGIDKDPNGPKLTIVSLKPPKSASSETQDEFWHPALVTSSPVFRLAGVADARLRNVKVFVNTLDESNAGFAAIIEPTEFEMKYVPLGGEGKYNIIVIGYDFDGNEAYAFTQVEVSYTASPTQAWIKVHEYVKEYDRLATVWANFELPDNATPVAGYINGEPATVTGTITGTVELEEFPLGRGANVITARLIYIYGAVQYQITDTGTVYYHEDSPSYDLWWYHETASYGCDVDDMEQYRDHDWFYDTRAHPDGYFLIDTEEPPYGDCRLSVMLGPWQLANPAFQQRVSLIHIEGVGGELTRELESCLYRTYPVIDVPDCDYLVYLNDPSGFREPAASGYTLDGRELIYINDYRSVVRMRLTPASDYVPSLQAPFRDYSVEWEEWGRRFVCKPWRPEPYYIVLSLQKGQGEDPYYIEWQDADIGDPIIEGEWVNVLARYNPAGGQIEWEHSPSDPGWTGEPPFKPLVVGEHTITARYYAEDGEPEKSLVGYVEDKVTFKILEAPGIHLLSDIPKDKLLIGERMPLFVRLINLDEQKQLHEIDASITFFELGKVVEEGPGKVVEAPCWQFMPCLGIPPEPLHDEYWLVFTVAGLSEGKVKLQPKVRYKLNGETAFTELLGPQHDIEVRGFVDLRLDDVGEWGEEDPGAFISGSYPDWLTLRTCTAGNVVLSWDSDSVALYTDLPWEEYNKVVEDEGSVEGSRRATFNPQYETPPEKDNWETVFRTTRLYAKAQGTSNVAGDIHMTLAPVSGKCPSDLINATIVAVDVEGHRPGTMTSPGAAVAEADEEEAVNLVAMVNDDNQDGGPAGQRDNRDTVIGPNDSDVVLVTLKGPMPQTLRTGVIRLVVTPVDSVHVFKGDGSALLTDYTLNLAAPEGDLAGLMNGPVDIFLEGMSPHAYVLVTLVYQDWNGVGKATDNVFMSLVKLGFLDNSNTAIDPETQALNVSNYVTTDGLPGSSAYADTCDDPDNFRLELQGVAESATEAQVDIEVRRGGATVLGPTGYDLDKKSANRLRGEFLRLVSDANDDAASGGDANNDPGNQTILVQLGDIVRLTYSPAPGSSCWRELAAGRPALENDNGPDQKRHDVRQLRVRFVVFENTAGTGPIITRAELNQDVETLRERLAQSTIDIVVQEIRMGGPGDPGEPLPADLLDGYTPSVGFVGDDPGEPTSDESAVSVLKDADENTIDFFYVQNLPPGVRAEAYPAIRNVTGIPQYARFVVIGDQKRPLTIGHETLHILLNSPDLPNEPVTALFYTPTSDSKAVAGTKRVGPYPDAAAQGVGNADTFTIRAAAEILP